MKIYIAATFARAPEMKAIARQLRELGHEITSDCWHDQNDAERHQEFEEWQRGRWRDDLESVTYEQWCARADVDGVRQADMLVFVSDQPGGFFQSSGGRHFELGLAAGIGGKYLVLVGEPENVFHHVPIIARYPHWDAFFDALPTYEHAHLTTWNLRKAGLRGAAD